MPDAASNTPSIFLQPLLLKQLICWVQHNILLGGRAPPLAAKVSLLVCPAVCGAHANALSNYVAGRVLPLAAWMVGAAAPSSTRHVARVSISGGSP